MSLSDKTGTGRTQLLARIVRCPCCGGRSVYAASNPSRPFCSERCKNADFGTWAAENYRVAARPDRAENDETGD